MPRGAGRMPAEVSRPASVDRTWTLPVVFGFALAHVAVGPALHQSVELATIHAWATLAVGVWWALSSRDPMRVAYVAAYTTGAEVLWRMSAADIFWEFGKYAVVLMFVVAMVRERQPDSRARRLALWYFALMVPSAMIPIIDLGLGAR